MRDLFDSYFQRICPNDRLGPGSGDSFTGSKYDLSWSGIRFFLPGFILSIIGLSLLESVKKGSA